jgi:hypothetical protein
VLATALRQGFAAAWKRPRLVVTLWLLNLALALAVGLPGWLALDAAIAPLPEADVLTDGFALGVVADLAELQPGLVRGLALSALGAALLGLLGGAALAGGTLEVLTSGDDRPFGHRFGRGAGRFFGRFVRAGVMTGLVAVPLVGLAAGPLLVWGRWLRRESGSELLTLVVSLGAPLVAGCVILLALLALDAARVRIVREDARRVGPLLRSGFALVLRHPAKWLGAWGANLLLLLVALAAYLAVRASVPAPGAAGIALMFLLQQAFVLVRTGLRVALVGTQVALVERLQPPQ